MLYKFIMKDSYFKLKLDLDGMTFNIEAKEVLDPKAATVKTVPSVLSEYQASFWKIRRE